MQYVIVSGLSIACIAFVVTNILSEYALDKAYKAVDMWSNRARRGSIKFLDDNLLVPVIAISMVIGGALSWDNANTLMSSIAMFVVIGVFMLKAWRAIKEFSSKRQREQQVDKMFLSLDLYLKTGMSVRNSLEAARKITPMLSDSIDNALQQWPRGSGAALDVLGEELKLSSFDTRIRFLKEIDIMGIKNMQGLLRRETTRIQNYRKTRDEVRIGMKPLVITIYRTLPILSNVGMLVAVLAMYAMSSIQKAVGAM